MSDRFTVLRDYCTSFQPYREVRPNSCSIEEEYELHKRIAAADAMAKALEEANALLTKFARAVGGNTDLNGCEDFYRGYNAVTYRVAGESGKMLSTTTAALAAYNALK